MPGTVEVKPQPNVMFAITMMGPYMQLAACLIPPLPQTKRTAHLGQAAWVVTVAYAGRFGHKALAGDAQLSVGHVLNILVGASVLQSQKPGRLPKISMDEDMPVPFNNKILLARAHNTHTHNPQQQHVHAPLWAAAPG
eukprot:1150913-Pelagomonas_calceolata.AAC.10